MHEALRICRKEVIIWEEEQAGLGNLGIQNEQRRVPRFLDGASVGDELKSQKEEMQGGQ